MSTSNPYGRSCLVCGSTDRQDIDNALAEGASVTQLTQQFALSRDSLYRHVRYHLRPQLQAALREAPPGFQPAALVVRIADVADAARDARVRAYGAGNAALGARLGDAEVRALQVLSERFKIDHDDVADELRDAHALAGALTELMPMSTPQLGEKLAQLLEQRDRRDLAERVRQLAQQASESREIKHA